MLESESLSPRRDLWSGMPIHDLVSAAARAFPDKTALIDGPSGQSVTYAELMRRVGRIAAWLHSGYLGDADDEVFTPDGWFRTGDLGFIDADGNLVITGRLKDVFKVNGMQVSPAEVEEALTGFPGIRDAAVLGRPDDRTGETPVAFVIAAAPLDRIALAAHLVNRVAPHKHPTRIVEVADLPRTPSGKLLRRLLPDLAEE